MINRPTAVISEKLAQYIDADKIQQNAANNPALQRDLTEGETLAVAEVKALLLDIDLSHGTYSPIPKVEEVGILPNSQLPGRPGHTLPLDQSIGLDEYTFMHWGAFHRSAGYGKFSYAINTRQVLLSERTIVTPFDISNGIFNGRNGSLEELTGREVDHAHDYLNSLISGADWLELIARTTLARVRDDRDSGRDTDVFRIGNPKHFGEIKHLGPIAPEAITGIVGPEDEEPKWREILEGGFAVEPVSNALSSYERYGTVGTSYDKLPHEVGADMEKPRKIWATILEMANS